MRTKRVNRYYCDFCKKSGGHAGHMRNHEKRCTMNPERECRMCGFGAIPMQEWLALMPSNDDYFSDEDMAKECVAALGKLREATDNCPVCILAVLRQKKICRYLRKGYSLHTDIDYFDYQAERQVFWDEHNAGARELEERDNMITEHTEAYEADY